jgi:tetratricopeptide (TPR) repeat protein|tara:strand:+ start:1046 stop:1420 length:375 start_codon:yes stop_codon:yes gene_type:complete
MKFSLTTPALILSIAFFVSGCKEDPQRHLKLGKWYAQKGLVEEAILEFREVTRLYPDSYKELNREEFQALSKAHYNLSLMYTKKGWWNYALQEAETCFQMQPTKEHYELVALIKQRVELEESGS